MGRLNYFADSCVSLFLKHPTVSLKLMAKIEFYTDNFGL